MANDADKSMLEAIKQLNGYRYEWVETGEPDIGVIAQEVEKVFPELVREFSGVKKVNYNGLVAVLIEAVKDLAKKVEAKDGN